MITDVRHLDARPLLILYATESGNALDVAEHIAREAQRRFFAVRLTSTDAYPLADLVHEQLIVFVVSTTGAGQAPRAMAALWTALLRADLPPDILEDLAFAVFGLGDSAYPLFCWAAKKLERRLQSLGAHAVVPRGEGDDGALRGVDGALDVWMPQLFAALEELHPPPPDAQFRDTDALPPPRISIQTCTSASASTSTSTPMREEGYHLATVRCNERTTAADWQQDVRHIEFDLDDDIVYAPGDVAVVHPLAPADDVESFLTSTGWSDVADEVFSFAVAPGGLSLSGSVPRSTTLRALFTRHLDINAVPRRTFFTFVRHFARDALEASRLAEFGAPGGDGADDLYEYATRTRRTIREVLAEFRSVRIPREYAFDVFPPLRPRQFSIASSVRVFPRQVHLCVAIVRFRTKLKIPRRGTCTTYLSTLKPGDTLRIEILKGELSLPTDPTTPVVCVGPGTGVAPMRALIGERIHRGSTENTFYFGCRHAAKDQHYSAEWAALVGRQRLVYRAAFSRDAPEGVARTYVQDLMAQDAARLWELLTARGAWVYIAGSANQMPTAVKAAIQDAAQRAGRMTEDEAQAFLRRLQDDGRLFEECWS